ncbi:protein MBD-R2-like isoform X3 [Arctopsyche grandis]|uniref:protein MBD-R2-like isoform X3 n=1 Tax=Arctopsyche grandis TaxID=121162 RepID=UPI00406D7A48
MRIRKCWVETCESSAEREQDKGVTFHKLPKDDGLKIKWLIQSRLSEDTDRKHCLVCSRHFRRVDFEALKASTFALKSDAIPTIFPWGITRLEELDSKFSSLDVAPLNTMDVESSVENVGESDAIPNTDLSIDNNDTKDLEKEVVLPKDDAEKLECVDKDVSLTNDLEKMEESSTAAAESLIEMSECSPEVVKPCVNVEIKVENPKPVENITEQEDVKIPCEDTSMSEKQSSKNTVEENMSEMYGEIIDADKDHQDILDPKSTDSPMNECHPIPEIDSIFENLFETHKNAEITSPNISINSVNTEDELKSKSESDEESNKMLKDMISKPMKPISKNQSKVGSVGRPRRRSPLAQKNQIRSKSKSSKQKSTSKSTPDERSLSTGTKSEKGMLVQGSRVEAKDFNDMWYPARVVEVDHDEMEVLIHYDNWSQRFDEWIYMWSPRIRIVDPTPPALNVKPLTYEEGERCLARWSNNQRFPATVQKVLSNGQYEVAFDDGFTRVTKAAMMSKMNAQTSRVSTSTTSTASATRKVVPVTSVLSPTPLQNHLFDPKRDHLGTKEERRSLKKKIDVKELFFARKKKKEIPVSEDTKVNISVTKDGRGRKRKIKPEEDSLIKDPVQKIKKKMESPIKIEPPIKNEVDSEATPPQPDTSQFASSEKHNFSAHRKQARRKGWDVSTTSPVNNSVDFCVNMANKAKKAKPVVVIPPPRVVAEVKPPSFHGKDFVFVGALKVQVIDNLLRCPKEGCFKNFRKDNLLQMHIKHYHPEMCKFFGDTPNVADLAYARTVVEESPVLVCKNQFKSEVDKYFDSVSVNRRSDADDESTFNQTWNANQMNSPNALNEANVNYTFTPQGYKDHNVSMEEPNHCPKTSWGETSDVRKNQGVYNYNTSRYFTPRPEVKRSHKKKLPEQLEEARSKKKKIRNFPYAWDTPTTDHDETRSSFGLVDQMGNRSFEHGFTIKTEAHLVKIKEEKEESNHSSTIITETGEKIKIVQMKREEIINCHCGFCEEDGLMIQCELCLCWQHAMCHNIERESEVPEKYVCLICLQPYRGRKSQKYLHDQEWLYEGRLPRASGANPAIDIPRANLLRKSHELTANLLQLKDLMHSLRCKMEVAENKDHPKLYLWSKPWENNLAYNDNNTVGIKSENIDISSMNSINSQSIINTVDLEKPLIPNERLDVNSDSIDTTEKNDKFDQLLDHITEAANNIKDDPEMLQNNGIAEPHLNNGKCDLVNGSVPSNIFSNLLASPGGTSIDLPLSSSELESLTKSVQMSAPQPEAAIESSECRIRLLQHIERTQVLLEARLDSIEAQIAELESQDPSFDDDETPEHFPRTKQTIQMILRDLVTLEELGSIS